MNKFTISISTFPSQIHQIETKISNNTENRKNTTKQFELKDLTPKSADYTFF